jgi:hypothetical protein
VQVAAEDPLRRELHRRPGRERDPGCLGELGGDLYRGVTGPDYDNPAAGEGGRAAVVDGVQHLTGEVLQARQRRPVRAPERPGGRHDGPRGQPAAALQLHGEGATVAADRTDAAAGTDLGVQPVDVGGEVGDDLVAVRIAVTAGAGNGIPGRELYRAGENSVRLS